MNANALSSIVAEQIRKGNYRTMTLKELESWCDRKDSLPVKMVKKIWIAVKTFLIKMRKVIFGW